VALSGLDTVGHLERHMTRNSSFPNAPRHQTGSVRWLPVLVCLALAVAYLIAIPLGLVAPDNRLSTQEAVFCGVLLLALLYAAQSSFSITDLSLGSAGVSARFQRVEARQQALESEVRALQVAISGLVTKFEMRHLVALAGEGPAPMSFGHHLMNELDHLDAMNFVRPREVGGLNVIRQKHENGPYDFDLKWYVEVTGEGREYLALRAGLDARSAQAGVARPVPA
jgi:hypothetical protein